MSLIASLKAKQPKIRINSGDTRPYGSLVGLSIAAVSRLKYEARKTKRDNLTQTEIEIYDWIDGIQSHLNISIIAFAAKFSDILRDPIQTIRLHKRRSGVIPSGRVLERYKQLDRLSRNNCTSVRTSIWYNYKGNLLIRLDYNEKVGTFQLNKNNPVIIKKGTFDAKFVKRTRNKINHPIEGRGISKYDSWFSDWS